MVSYRQYPADKYTDSRYRLRKRRRDAQLDTGIVNQPTQHARQSVNVFPENQRHFVNQRIAQHTAKSSRNRPHHNRDPHREPELQGFLNADHPEQPQPDCVENKERIVQTDDIFPENNNKKQRQRRDNQVRRL